MANRHIGEHVKLRSGKYGRIRAILQQAPLAMNCRYQVLLDGTTKLIGINGLDILEKTPEDYFARQRHELSIKLGLGAKTKLEIFKNRIEEIRLTVSSRPGTTAGDCFTAERVPSEGKAVVFMGLRTVPGTVAGAIYKNGLTALKYLSSAATVDEGYIAGNPHLGQRDGGQAAAFRTQFLQECRMYSKIDSRWVEFQMLQLANAHKSGPGVTVSGFHSTSGKPEYAAEYSDATGQIHGKTYYNMGMAMEISDHCYPLSIEGGITDWNALPPGDRYGKDTIVMAYKKEDKAWKHDYESEILLGGATPPADFVYFCCYPVSRSATGFTSTLNSGILGKIGGLNKVNRDK
jgi:hypothetical protein